MGKKADNANAAKADKGKTGQEGSVVYKGRVTGSFQGQVLKSGGICFIADVQHADSDRQKLQDNLEKRRMYTKTLGTFTRSMRAACKLGASSLVLLGDQVDDRDWNGDAAAATVLNAAEAEFKDRVGYILGNHDTKWTQTFREARQRSPVRELPGCFAWECEVQGEDDSRWVLLALDCYATCFAAEPGWGKQLPMNGEIGAQQLAWLRSRLLEAKEAGKLAVVLSHVPLHPAETQSVKDHQAVRQVLTEAGNVKLCLAGHDHPGLFHEDEHGIHYWTDQACLFCLGEPEVAGLVLRLFKDRAEIQKLNDDSLHLVPYTPALRRAISTQYGPGASTYTEDVMSRWLALGLSAQAIPDADVKVKLGKAVVFFRGAVALRPDHDQSQKNLKSLMKKLGDAPEAVAAACNRCSGTGVLQSETCSLCAGAGVLFDSLSGDSSLTMCSVCGVGHQVEVRPDLELGAVNLATLCATFAQQADEAGQAGRPRLNQQQLWEHWHALEVVPNPRGVACPLCGQVDVPEAASSSAADHGGFEPRTHGGPRRGSKGLIPVVFDMEPGADPDDVLTLLFLAAHPKVDLKAVTLSSKGEGNSVDLVRWILKKVGLERVRVGAEDWPRNMNQVCQSVATDIFFTENFGEAKKLKSREGDCEDAKLVLQEECDDETTLVTGGPLTNLAAALDMDGFRLGSLVAQGGFAGDGVVPKELQKAEKLHKEGQRYFHTTNFGLDPEAAKKALASTKIGSRICVSKNVCHQTLYDGSANGWHVLVRGAVKATNQRMGSHSVRFKALDLMANAMNNYLKAHPRGKKLHDPLALAVALDHSVCTLVEVTLDSREKGKAWGSTLSPGSGTWISIDYDEAKFRRTLLQLNASSESGQEEDKGKS